MAAREQLSLGLAPDAPERYVDSGDVPDGWRLLRLDQVCEINPSRKGRTNYPDDLPVTFISMSAVDEETGTVAAPDVRPFGAVKKGYTWFVENDVLFAKITPCMQNGKAAIARGLSNGVGFGSTEFHVLRPGPDVLSEWIHLFVRQPSFRSAAAQHFTGSVGQQRVPESFIATYVVPVPPLPEQRRIVARIEELAARIEQARGLRREAATDVGAILPKALGCMRDDLRGSTYPREHLDQVTRVTSGGTPSRKVSDYWGGSIPWVKTGELLDGDIYETEEDITQQGLDDSSAKLFPPETVLIALYGQEQTRGRTGRLMIEAATNQACCAILPVPTRLESRFLQYWMRSLYSEMRLLSQGGTQPNTTTSLC